MAAQVTITQLPSATTLTGTELVPTVQNGVTVKTTTQQIADLAITGPGAGVSSFNTRTGAVTLISGDVTGALGYTPGSVTSVAGTGSVSGLTLSGSVTSSGSLTLGGALAVTPSDFSSQTANNVLAAPDGASGTPTFRALVVADIPTLNQNTTGTAANVTGIVAVANGGSGTATPSLVAGTNVTISGTWPNQTINSSGGGSSSLTIQSKATSYTVVAGDAANVINCTASTFTVSLTAAATLGAGFNVTIWNTGTGVITIDPNGAETIDGKATISLYSGEGTQVVCDGTNWQSGNKKRPRLYAENSNIGGNSFPVASGAQSVAIGASAQAVGDSAIALGASYAGGATSFSAANGNGTSSYGAIGASSISIGENSKAAAAGGVAIGGLCVANSTYSTAVGRNSGAQGAQAFGTGAVALGGSYGSGTDSFSAATVNNLFYGATATSAVAIGFSNTASNIYNTSIGGSINLSSGQYSACIGGNQCTAALNYSVALGNLGTPNAIGKMAFGHAGGIAAGIGWGMISLSTATTGTTPTVLASNGVSAAATNQLVLPNNSAYSFTGTVVARQQAAGGTQSAAWKIEGLIRREGSAATTTLVASTVTAISNVPGWTLALTADTTNGGLAVTFTGAAATNIRAVAAIQTSEVIYA